MNRIKKLFTEKPKGEKITSLFLTAGFPELDSTVELVLGMQKNGADMIELGIPFSDPLADGPTIQHSSNIAISNDITIKKIFEMVKEIRTQTEIPLVLMGYINPILQYGIDAFCNDAAVAGVDGLIIPDIPIEEEDIIQQKAKDEGLNLILLVAPNTSDERLQMADEKSEGFVYCVSVTGVTGTREGDEIKQSVQKFIQRVQKNITKNPVMVGFGIKNHNDAMHIASNADGFIVGSALINVINQNYPNKGWQNQVFAFVHSLKFGNN